MHLFLLPHQDDEYGVFALLEQLLAAGEPVRVVYVTSGSLDGQPAPHRDSESLAVLARLGLVEQAVDFLGSRLQLPDGSLYRHLPQALAGLQQSCDGLGVQAVYAPAWEGGHQDHDATYALACVLAQRYRCEAKSRQFPLYQGQGLPGALWRTFAPLPANGQVTAIPLSWAQRRRYLGYCLGYPSQWRSWLGLFPMLALKLLSSGQQLTQPLLPQRLAQVPHPGPCLYERRGFCRQAEVAAAVRQLLQPGSLDDKQG